MGERPLCWVCGFHGTDPVLHLGMCSDLVRNGADHLPPSWYQQLVDHELHLEMMQK